MTLIALPTGLAPSQFSLLLNTEQRASSSNFGGSEQVVDLLNDRWTAALTFPNLSNEDAARMEAFVASFRGMTNTVALWHFRRPVPRGTMRGSPFIEAAQKGASSVVVNSTPGATLRAGDMIGLAGLLLQVQSDCVANGLGVVTVPLVNRLRRALPWHTDLVWQSPSAPFRLISRIGVQYLPGYSPEISLDFVEAVQ